MVAGRPGFADVSTLIDLALSQYSHHPSVIGFGIDVEWYKTSSANNEEGQAVTDSEAAIWSARIKSYNQNYLLFTKHWLIEKMAPTFRTDVVFVDDSQEFSDMSSMINEFVDWSKAFSSSKVAFQFGYNADKKWWGNLSDPPKVIGDDLVRTCSNISDLYWVDFTAYDISPKDFNPTSISENQSLNNHFNLYQNYPNPFNPSTNFSFVIDHLSFVSLKIFNSLQKEFTTIVNEELPPGNYNFHWDATGFVSGVYFYQLAAGNFTQARKMLLLK